MNSNHTGVPMQVHSFPKKRGKDWIKPYAFTNEYKNGGKYKYHHTKRKKTKWEPLKKVNGVWC